MDDEKVNITSADNATPDEPSVKQKSKHKLIIALLIVLVVIIAALGTIWAVLGTENIKSVYYGLRFDEKEITDLKDDSSARLKKKLDEHPEIEAREPSKEELKALEKGEITEDQLIDIISNGITLKEFRENNYIIPEKEKLTEQEADTTNETATTNGERTNNTAPSAQNNNSRCDAEVSRIIAKMYVLRSSYTGALSSLASQAYAEYQAGGSASDIASRYMGAGQALEAECDGSVNALMGELTGILTSNGRSTELVNEIYASYQGEKQYTKAYYMSMYLNN